MDLIYTRSYALFNKCIYTIGHAFFVHGITKTASFCIGSKEKETYFGGFLTAAYSTMRLKAYTARSGVG